MLVCNVSLRAPRVAIAADLAEAAAAADSTTTGFVVFAAFVDEPASVLDHVDAYLGQIMREAASAADVVNTGLSYAAAIVEAATAVEVLLAAVPGALSAAIVEAAAAADLLDGSLVAALSAAVAEAAAAADLLDGSLAVAGPTFEGVLALDGPIMPASTQPTVIYIEG